MKPRDLYAILGVGPEASPTELKRAYRKRARELHPDRNPGGEEAFKELAAAWEILGDAGKRAAYDGRRSGAVPAGVDEDLLDWLDLFDYLLSVTSVELMGEVLPGYVARYPGPGHQLVRAMRAAAESGQLERFEATWWSRQRTRLLFGRIRVVTDELRHGPDMLVVRRSMGATAVVLFPLAFRGAGYHTADELREVLPRVLMAGMAQGLSRHDRLVSTNNEAQAAEYDRGLSRYRWFWRLVWLGLLVFSAVLIGTAAWQSAQPSGP